VAAAVLLRLTVHAVPGAKRTGAAGAHGGALKVRLAAPPVDGKANEALRQWLAQTFDLRVQQVELLSGQTSRSKVWALHCESAAVQARCQLLLNALMADDKSP
jgi:uncharacterized protein